MTLLADSNAVRQRNVAQLYDDWHGYYVLVRVIGGRRHHIRRLSRDAAMEYRTGKGESLLLKYPLPLDTANERC
jgi:hypothetical protein